MSRLRRAGLLDGGGPGHPAGRRRRAGSGRALGASTTRTWSPNGSAYDLVDVTYSGATTANVLTDPQHGAPPQVDALDGSEELVTVTIGGNDVGYVPLLFAAGVPRMRTPRSRCWAASFASMLDPEARDQRAGHGRGVAADRRSRRCATVAAARGCCSSTT